MRDCIVPFCKSRGPIPGISYHEFPSLAETRSIWIKNISKEIETKKSIKLWKPRDGTVVCSLHFEASDYTESTLKRSLKKLAVPTIFNDFPKHPKKVKRSCRILRTSNSKCKMGKEKSKPVRSNCKDATLWKSTIRLIKSKVKSPDDVECFLALLNYLEKDGIVIITDNIERIRVKIYELLSIPRQDLISGDEYEDHDCPSPSPDQNLSDNLISESETFHLEFPNATEEHMGGYEYDPLTFEDIEIDTKIDLPLNVNEIDADPLGNYEPSMIVNPPATLTADPLDTTCDSAAPSSSVKRKLKMKNLKFVLVPKPNKINISQSTLQVQTTVEQEDGARMLRSRSRSGRLISAPEKYTKVQIPNRISGLPNKGNHPMTVDVDTATISKNRRQNPKVYMKRPSSSSTRPIIPVPVAKIKSETTQKIVTVKVEPEVASNCDKSEQMKPANPRVYVKRPKLSAKPTLQTQIEKVDRPMSRSNVLQLLNSLGPISETTIADTDADFSDFPSIRSPILENPRLPPPDPNFVHVRHPINKHIRKEVGGIPRFSSRWKLNRKFAKCPTCGKIVGMSCIHRHVKTHNGTGVRHKPCQLCPICGKYISTNYGLDKHTQRVHSDFRPYLCDQCPKGYFDQFELKLHLKTHEGLKPHVCQICKKTFFHAHSLRKHSEIHEESNQLCDFCGRAFRTRKDLEKHVRSHRERETRDKGHPKTKEK